MTSAPPEYNPAPGADALKRRLTALMTAGTPAACAVYIGLSKPGQWSARHAEATHAIARHLADGDVDSLPHFNTNPPPILRILAAASRARPDAIGDTMADFPHDLATGLWRAVAARIGSASDLTGDGRRRASDLMLRLGYMRTAADLLGMAGADEATHRFSPGAAVEELAVLVRRRHDARVLEERALEVARDASYPARVRFTMANFVVVRNGRRGSDTPAIHEAADLALATVAELDAGPFVTNLATQTVYRAIAFVPFVGGDCARTLELLDRAEAHQFAAQRAAADPLQRLAWVDHAFPLYETIAKTHLRLGDLARSLAATDKLAELSPNDPRGWDLRGQVLVRAGRLDEAIAAYARSIPVGGLPVARAAFFLGWIHQQLGQSEEALRYYRMSRQIDPTAPVLDDLIATVSG